MLKFATFSRRYLHQDLSPKTIKLLQKHNINELFPVQLKTFELINTGRDLVARAETGSGKTLAFGLPMIEQLLRGEQKRDPRALILAPTRELARQVYDELSKYTNDLKLACVYGGVGYADQIKTLKQGVDILVGTPGRVTDLIEKDNLALRNIKILTLDEADYMLDIGFAPAVEAIVRLIRDQQGLEESEQHTHQTILFSATMPSWVLKLAKQKFRDGYEYIDLVGDSQKHSPKTIKHLSIPTKPEYRKNVLIDVLRVYGINEQAEKRPITLIFTSTKAEASSLHQGISSYFKAAVLHGDFSQTEREKTLQMIRNGEIDVLFCTDVAARGLDIKNVKCVVQVGIQGTTMEMFLHRSGRTGRAGESGTNITLFDPSSEVSKLNQFKTGARLEIEMVGVPQPKEMLGMAIKSLDTKLEQVVNNDLRPFVQPATALIEKYTAEVAVSSLMALHLNWSNMTTRSLITGQPGMESVLIDPKSGSGIPVFAKVWGRCSTGAICDIPSNRFEKLRDECGVELSLLESLPSDFKLNVESGPSGGSRYDRRQNQGYGGNSSGNSNWNRRSNTSASSNRGEQRYSNRGEHRYAARG